MVDPTYFKTYANHPSCRVIVDSCSDITTSIARDLGVDIIEFPYVVDGVDMFDDQFATVSPDEFYQRMVHGSRVLTSAIPTGRFVEVFEQCAADGVPTVYLSFTAGLSSSVRDAEQAASMVRESHPGFVLRVIDNRLPSLTALLLAYEACSMRDAGSSADDIADWAETASRCVHGYFTLGSLKWLSAGGRVPKAAASITSILDMKPMLTYDLDGSLTLTGMVRGRKKAIRELVSSVARWRNEDDSRQIAICDAGAPEDAENLERQIRDLLGDSCPSIVRLPLDPTIGAHVGPGMLAVAFWGADRSNIQRGKR